MQDVDRLSRRDSLLKLGGLLTGAGVVGAWKLAEEASAGPAAVASGFVSCVLAPEQTEGPYYLDDHKVRRNITEGRPGAPLTLRLGVVDVSSCKPVKGAALDIWHCDAGGVFRGRASRTPRTTGFFEEYSGQTRRASRSSGRSIPAGTRAVRSTSTSWFTSPATSCTRASSTSPTR
jgi:hypothetical protein